jgi:hypothetical protein
MILLIGCAGVSFDTPSSACPPVVEYGLVEQIAAATAIRQSVGVLFALPAQSITD